jgi:hypothetical protein
MASLLPIKRLNKVDLPTFGLPTITTTGTFIINSNLEIKKFFKKSFTAKIFISHLSKAG